MMWDRVARLIGDSNLEKLARKTVGVVGVGSGGGFVAQSLAMSGVGGFVLVDDDTLEAHNVVRHVADHRAVGQPKVDVVAELIRQRNPDARIETHRGRIEAHMDALNGLDLLIVGVDGEQVKYILNESCLARNLPAVYAGVYERGEGGDAVLIRPYDGPCYACWAAELREGLQAIGQDDGGALDYGMIGAEGTLEAEPGLWLHVVRVASAQADIALRYLLGTDGDLPGNTVILANTALEIIEGTQTPPYGAVWVDVQRDPGCLVCGATSRDESAAQMSLDDLAQHAGIEINATDADESAGAS